MAVADMAIMEEGRASITEADRTSTGMDDASGNEFRRPEGVSTR